MVDPNRRGLLFCMSANSSADNPQTYKNTSMQKRKENRVKKHKNIRREVKTFAVVEAENLKRKNIETVFITSEFFYRGLVRGSHMYSKVSPFTK